MDRNRISRNGRFAKEPQFPQRITRDYAFRMLHDAYMRLVLDRTQFDADTMHQAINTLGRLRREIQETRS